MQIIQPWALPARPGESVAELQSRRDHAYFQRETAANGAWLERLGVQLSFAGKRVLEIGCGHGALSVHAAQAGALSVLGIDLDDDRIAFAGANLKANFGKLQDRVRFQSIDIAELQGEFDLIISKDTFEHVEQLDAMVGHIFRLLAPGGVLAAGFSPFYFSPWGDHGRFKLRLPWLHAILPEEWLCRRISAHCGKTIRSAMDLGLNKLRPEQLQRYLGAYDWAATEIRYNRGRSPLLPVFNLLRKITPLERFFTVGVYLRATKKS
ncbi:class I SAM-dependent methyltransferase [Methylibium sp. Pch-M]|uniref:SAM-dependent methyltransferase n=1 Tax=Methylibium sp. Pch-M TaxID=2082386 RepID=UPI0010127E31|nr:class I SAM-dependent methyltransferase [Methylibium sp. Pch-M]QAZ41164.1 class I SAM-dependent methyltransferase [Methylibium sp. Pch-M]